MCMPGGGEADGVVGIDSIDRNSPSTERLSSVLFPLLCLSFITSFKVKEASVRFFLSFKDFAFLSFL